MRPALKLPLHFDSARLEREVTQLPAEAWQRHYNTRDYEGEWSGVPLRAPKGQATPLLALHGADVVFEDTRFLAASPYLAEVLSAFTCPIRGARLLKLGPGAKILEHRDRDLGFAYGEARLHIPVATDPSVAFFVAGERVPMSPGECWYIDVSQTHRVHNASGRDRIHLVLDTQVDAWFTSLLHRGVPPPAGDEQSPMDALVEALSAPEKVAQLEPMTDRAQFLTAVVEIARELGLDVGQAELEARMRDNHRAWIERGIR